MGVPDGFRPGKWTKTNPSRDNLRVGRLMETEAWGLNRQDSPQAGRLRGGDSWREGPARSRGALGGLVDLPASVHHQVR
eukprot:6735093-Alexandrium_andersonii.AAC.1